MARPTVKDRLVRYISPEPNSGCWLWAGGCDSKGYGVIGVGSRGAAKAHRISYEVFVGPLQPGLVIMHSCDNPTCVNPDHLSQGTHKDNVADMIAKKRNFVFPPEMKF